MTEYIVGLRLGKRSEVLTIEAEDALLLRSRSNIITPRLSFLTFENPIVAAIVAIRIGRNEDYEAHDKGSGLALSGPSKVTALYNRPLPRLRSLLCLLQRSFPLCVGVVLRAPLREHGIRDPEVAMRCASVADCVPGTIKILHCGGLADWAKERPGQRSATFRNPSPC